MERRLAAIFALDMVGYSRLMEGDEAGTLARQKTHRKELIDPAIAEHHGRIVKGTGDGLLAEFAALGVDEPTARSLDDALGARSLDALEAVLSPEAAADSAALAQLRTLFALAEGYGFADWLVLDASVVRGLACVFPLRFRVLRARSRRVSRRRRRRHARSLARRRASRRRSLT